MGSGNPQDVVIRTNSANTNLTINGYVDENDPTIGDTVKHYGAVGSLNIIAVANASYHEFGQVAFAEIKTGRIVLESKSEVEHIHLTATDGNFVDITVAKANDVEMPEFSRDPVEIPAEGKLVVALQDGTDKDDAKDYVWLTAVGIYEQVVVSDQKESLTAEGANNSYAAASNDQEKKDTAQQIANNISVEVGGDTYTVKAEKTSSGWDYVLVDEDKQVSEEYSVSGTPVVNVSTDEETAITTTTVTVSVVDANEAPVTSATSAIENGSDKAEEKSKYVAELISNDAELREFLAGTKQKGKLANNISNPTVETKSTRYVYANGRNVELDLAGFTLDGYEICIDDGSTLKLTGNGTINLDDEEPICISNGNLILAGVTITSAVKSSGNVLFCNDNEDKSPLAFHLTVADGTVNTVSNSGRGGSAIMALAYYGDVNLTISGEEKHTGKLIVNTTESYTNGVFRCYQGAATGFISMNGFEIDCSAADNNMSNGTGEYHISNLTGGFSDDVTEWCETGYMTKLDNSIGRYIMVPLAEEDANFKVVKEDGTTIYLAGSIYQAMANAEENSTIVLLKNINVTDAAWNAPGVGAEKFTIDMNGKTISGKEVSIKRKSIQNPDNVSAPLYITIKNGTINSEFDFYTYTYATVEKVKFINTTSSYAKGLYLSSTIKTSTYDWAEKGTNSLTLIDCTFENKNLQIFTSNEGQKVDLTLKGCSFTKTQNSSYDVIDINYYMYGDIVIEDCRFDCMFNNGSTYTLDVGSTESSNGNNPVTLKLKNVTMNATGSATKLVNSGIATVTEEGTNVYTVGGNAKNYDGSAIE